MDWQVLAMWLVVGAVVIWFAARILKRYIFSKDKRDNDKTPPCCG